MRDAVDDFNVHHILLGQDDFLLYENEMYQGLLDLENKAKARLSAVRSGKGRDKFYTRPDGATPEQLCAMTISVVWNVVHGKQPPNTNEFAQRACDTLWVAAGGGTSRRWRLKNADRPSVAVWRDHLRAAKEAIGSQEAQFLERSLGAIGGREVNASNLELLAPCSAGSRALIDRLPSQTRAFAR